ncbi:lipopolysaccharide heptosyltransferase II [Candidatus Poribacteria bacterium]|nr:lipopolysaccharide heptosyltransferase II [Candidatus Poribacteria bacterium]
MRDRILVMQTGGWIGDMVLLTPALRAVKRAYPQSHLALMLRPLVADVMAIHPYLDEVIVDTKDRYRSRLKSVWKAANAIRRSRFNLAIVLHPTSFRNALIPFLAGVPERVGSHVSGRGILLTRSCPERTDLHEIHRYLRVLELIDIHEPDATLEFWHTDAERNVVRQMLADHGISSTERVIGVNLGTTWQTKRWPLEKFATVMTQMQNRLGAPLILTGSAAEGPLGEALGQMVQGELVNLIGKTTLTQLGALIERCALYLTCDSGPMHIAAAVGTPTIALFGPTSPTRHRPYGEGHCVIEKAVECRPCYKRACQRKDAPNLCMTEIKAEEVVEKMTQMAWRSSF